MANQPYPTRTTRESNSGGGRHHRQPEMIYCVIQTVQDVRNPAIVAIRLLMTTRSLERATAEAGRFPPSDEAVVNGLLARTRVAVMQSRLDD